MNRDGIRDFAARELGLGENHARHRMDVHRRGLAAEDVAQDSALRHRSMRERGAWRHVADRKDVTVEAELVVDHQQVLPGRQARRGQVQVVERRDAAGGHDDFLGVTGPSCRIA